MAKIDSGNLIINSTNDITMQPGNSTKWTANAAGDLLPNGSATYDIGDANNEVANMYINAVWGNQATSAKMLYVESNNTVIDSAATTNLRLRAEGTDKLLVGTTVGEALRLNELSAATNWVGLNWDTSSFGLGGIAGVDTHSASIVMHGRQRTTVGGSMEIKTPASSVDGRIFIFTLGTERWKFESSGHFVPSTTNSYTIGTDGGLQCSNVFTAAIRNGDGSIDSGAITMSAIGNIKLSAGGGDVYVNNLGGGSSTSWLFKNTTGSLLGATVGDSIIGKTTNGATNRVIITGAGALSSLSAGIEVRNAHYSAGSDLLLHAGSTGDSDVIVRAYAAAGGIRFYTGGGSERWELDSAGTLRPVTPDTYDLGSSGNRILNAYIRDLEATDKVNSTGSLAIAGTSLIDFQTGGASKWRIQSGGDLTGMIVANTVRCNGSNTALTLISADSTANGSYIRMWSDGSATTSEQGKLQIVGGSLSSTDGSKGAVEFHVGSTTSPKWRFSGHNTTDGSIGHLEFNGNTNQIGPIGNGTGGTDTRFHLRGGTSISNTTGAYMTLIGNNDTTQKGNLFLNSGNVAATSYVGVFTQTNLKVNGTNMNVPFTGIHIYDLGNSSPEEGDAVKLVNRKIELCTESNDPKCIGILTSSKTATVSGYLDSIQDSFGNTYTRSGSVEAELYNVASVGDSIAVGLSGVKVCDEGGDLSDGDYLCTASGHLGHLKKQDDDLNHTYTVAQIREDVTFSDSPTASGVYAFLLK